MIISLSRSCEPLEQLIVNLAVYPAETLIFAESLNLSSRKTLAESVFLMTHLLIGQSPSNLFANHHDAALSITSTASSDGEYASEIFPSSGVKDSDLRH